MKGLINLRSTTRPAMFIFALLFLYSCDTSSGFQDTGQIIELDLNLFMMESSRSENITATLGSDEAEKLIEGVNEVWSQANIRWNLAQVTVVVASNAELFEMMMQNMVPRSMGLLRSIIPGGHISPDKWDVFIIHDFGGGIGGVYFPDLAAVLQPEVDPLREIGFDGGLIRILAHELGHSLGLPHVPCTQAGNLMAPGCMLGNRTRLAESQIESTRMQAATNLPWSGSN
jgi:hypothetical protein